MIAVIVGGMTFWDAMTPLDPDIPPILPRIKTRKEPVKFWLDDDLLTAAPKVPADGMMQLLEKYEELRDSSDNTASAKSSAQIQLALSIFRLVLYPASLKIVEERMSSSDDPIDIKDVIEIFEFLIGENYSGRPTNPPSPSTDTSRTDGRNSTDGALPGLSIPDSSNGADTSTSPTTGS